MLSPRNAGLASSSALGLKASLTSLSGCGSEAIGIEDAIVTFGYSLLKGKRPNMEDFHHAEVRGYMCRVHV